MLTKKIFQLFKKSLLTTSKTEHDALMAGDTSWEQNIFTGKTNLDDLMRYKSSRLSHTEQQFIDVNHFDKV